MRLSYKSTGHPHRVDAEDTRPTGRRMAKLKIVGNYWIGCLSQCELIGG
jgi:hypothetical protein